MTPAKLSLTISLVHDALRTTPSAEIHGILTAFAAEVQGYWGDIKFKGEGRLYDTNGNHVGDWTFDWGDEEDEE